MFNFTKTTSYNSNSVTFKINDFETNESAVEPILTILEIVKK